MVPTCLLHVRSTLLFRRQFQYLLFGHLSHSHRGGGVVRQRMVRLCALRRQCRVVDRRRCAGPYLQFGGRPPVERRFARGLLQRLELRPPGHGRPALFDAS